MGFRAKIIMITFRIRSFRSTSIVVTVYSNQVALSFGYKYSINSRYSDGTATIARLLHRHQCGASLGTTIPIARLARLCGQQSEGLTPCSSPSPTNLTTFDPAHLHGLTHQPPSHTPPRRPTVGPILRSKQVPSLLHTFDAPKHQVRGGKVCCVSRRCSRGWTMSW